LPAPDDLAGKTLQILHWLRETPRPLRRLVFKIEKGIGPGDISISPPVQFL